MRDDVCPASEFIFNPNNIPKNIQLQESTDKIRISID